MLFGGHVGGLIRFNAVLQPIDADSGAITMDVGFCVDYRPDRASEETGRAVAMAHDDVRSGYGENGIYLT